MSLIVTKLWQRGLVVTLADGNGAGVRATRIEVPGLELPVCPCTFVRVTVTATGANPVIVSHVDGEAAQTIERPIRRLAVGETFERTYEAAAWAAGRIGLYLAGDGAATASVVIEEVKDAEG